MTNFLKVTTRFVMACVLVGLSVTIPFLKTLLEFTSQPTTSHSQSEQPVSFLNQALSAITNSTTVSAISTCGYGSCLEFGFPDITLSEDPAAPDHTQTFTVSVNRAGTTTPTNVVSPSPEVVNVTPDAQCTLVGTAVADSANPGSFLVPIAANSANFTVTAQAINDGITETATHPCNVAYHAGYWGLYQTQTIHIIDNSGPLTPTITTVPPSSLSENPASALYNQVYKIEARPTQTQPIAVHVVLGSECYAFVDSAWHTGMFDTTIGILQPEKLILLQAKSDRIVEPVQNCSVTTTYRLSGASSDLVTKTDLIPIIDYTPDLILQAPAKISQAGIAGPTSSAILARLPNIPSDNNEVIVHFVANSEACRVEKSILVFNTENWNTDQSVGVSAVNTGKNYAGEVNCPIQINVLSASSVPSNPPSGFNETYTPTAVTYNGHSILLQKPIYSLAAAEYNGAQYTLNAVIVPDPTATVPTTPTVPTTSVATPQLATTGISTETVIRLGAVFTIVVSILFSFRFRETKTWYRRISAK